MIKNSLAVLLILFFGLNINVINVDAKVLPQSAKVGVRTATVKSTGTTINVFPKLRPDRKALNINFSNLQNAKSVSFMLVYKQNGQEEAAMGALNLTGASNQSSELLFGTCSKNVCRYHTNIKDARLEVSYTSKTLKKYLKKFKIRI